MTVFVNSPPSIHHPQSEQRPNQLDPEDSQAECERAAAARHHHVYPVPFFHHKKNLEQQRPPSNACELSCVSTRQIRSTAGPRSALLDALGSQRTRAGRRGADAFVYGRALLRVRGEIKAERWIVHHPAAESKHGRGASDR